MDQHSSAIDQATLARFSPRDFSSATLSGCGSYILSGEIFLSRSSINSSVTILDFKFRKPDCTSSAGCDVKLISLTSETLRPRSGSSRSPFFAFKRSGRPRYCSGSRPGRKRKYGKAFPSWHRRSVRKNGRVSGRAFLNLSTRQVSSWRPGQRRRFRGDLSDRWAASRVSCPHRSGLILRLGR